MYNTEQSPPWKLAQMPQEDVRADEIECPRNVRQSPLHTWTRVPCWLTPEKSPSRPLCTVGGLLQVSQAESRMLHDLG